MKTPTLDLEAAAQAVTEAVERRAGQAPLRVAIDGRCAAGKSTLAAYLQRRNGWPVVHMDHFFLRPEQRSPERLAEPGGNVDRERFWEEVLLPLQEGRAAVYRPFDCRSQSLREPLRLDPAPVVLAEGSYSCHPALWEAYGLHVFLTVDPEEQLRRIAARNGPEGLKAFRDRWIPMEERYFEAFSLAERCELVLALAEPDCVPGAPSAIPS